MASQLFKLNKSDFVRGAATAVFAGIVMALASTVNQSGFDVFTADWGVILGTAINAAMSAFIGYISKNFLSDADGKIFGKIG